MTYNELRIGNIVNRKQNPSKKDDGYFLVTSIGTYFIGINPPKKDGFVLEIDDILPIPLTEEWLFKFGFEIDGDDLIIDTGLFLLVSYNDDELVHFKSNHLETIISIKYVHQLQNLYFALAGEELQIKIA